MFKIFPHAYVKSVFHINYEKLKAQGVKALIFDIDATLVPHGLDVTNEIRDLFKKLHSLGFKLMLLSNNCEERIAYFNRDLGADYIYMADKPNTHGYLKAIERMGVKKEEAVMIGDQLFTDILGANRSGIPNILVNYLPQEGETKLGRKRTVEKLLMYLYPLTPNYKKIKEIKLD